MQNVNTPIIVFCVEINTKCIKAKCNKVVGFFFQRQLASWMLINIHEFVLSKQNQAVYQFTALSFLIMILLIVILNAF